MSNRAKKLFSMGLAIAIACLAVGDKPFSGLGQGAQAAIVKARCPAPKILIGRKCDCPQDRCATSGECGPSYWLNRKGKNPCFRQPSAIGDPGIKPPR